MITKKKKLKLTYEELMLIIKTVEDEADLPLYKLKDLYDFLLEHKEGYIKLESTL